MVCGSDGRTRTELSSGMSRKPLASVSISSLVASVMNVTFMSGDRSVVGILRKRKTRLIVSFFLFLFTYWQIMRTSRQCAWWFVG